MPNPNPRKEFIVPHQFKPKGDQPMTGRLFVRVTEDIESAVKALPNSPEWLRRVITEAAKVELLGGRPAPGAESPAVNSGAEPPPGAHSGEPSPAGAELDTVEVLQLIDQAMGMTKAKDIKTVLATVRELLTPGADETVSENEASPAPPDTPPVDNRKLIEIKTLVERRLAEGAVPARDFRIYSVVLELLTHLASSGD